MKTPPRDSFYIYLNSSDLNEYFDSNTTVKFTNPVTNYFLDYQDNWAVALQYIQLSNALGSAKIDFIRASCNLVPALDGQDQSLAIFTRPIYNKEDGRVIHYEPIRQEFFTLTHTVINAISITLTDHSGQLLQLKVGQPTILCLCFRKMPPHQKRFVIRVSSAEDVGGSASDFRVSLPSILSANHDTKWTVSLSSLFYKGRFDQRNPDASSVLKVFTWKERNITREAPKPKPKPKPATNEIQTNNYLPAEEEAGSSQPVEQAQQEDSDIEVISEEEEEEGVDFERYDIRYQTIPFPKSHFKDNSELFKALKMAFRKVKVNLPLAGERPNIKKLRMNPNTERVSFSVETYTEIRIPFEIAGMIGINEEPDFSGEVVLKFTPYQDYDCPRPMNCNAWLPNSMFVYANFIKFSAIGHAESPILKIVPLLSIPDINQYERYEAQQPEEHEVLFSQLSNLQFQLRRVDGSPITFVEQYPSEVILSLEFKEIQE